MMSGCSGSVGGKCGSGCAGCGTKPPFAPGAKVIAVGSGKGGVGKSTVTALCAIAMARAGYKVGLLDADITGPSIPQILGVKERPLTLGDGEKIQLPATAGGIKVMSLALVTDDNAKPVAWRGPLISGILRQFYEDVNWDGLDYVFIDLPPGTADAPMTVLQNYRCDGLLSVTTPQMLSSVIVQKQANLATLLGVKLVGLIENMSYLDTPQGPLHPFGPGHSAEVEEALGVKTLVTLPIDPELCRLADEGRLEEYQNDALFEALQKALA